VGPIIPKKKTGRGTVRGGEEGIFMENPGREYWCSHWIILPAAAAEHKNRLRDSGRSTPQSREPGDRERKNINGLKVYSARNGKGAAELNR